MTPSIESKYNQYYSQLCKHLKLKGLQPKTIAAYSHGVRRIALYFNFHIDDLTPEQLLDYFHDRLNSHSWSAVKLDLYGLKFFYTHVLNKPWFDVPLVKPPRAIRIPDIVTPDEAQQIFMLTRKLSYRVFFFTVYSMGLRLGEGLRLKVGDIDATRQRVHIRDAKGNKDRFVPLPDTTLQVLRRFWQLHRHSEWLFPNRKRGLKKSYLATSPLDRGGLQIAMRNVVQELDLKKNITLHSLRHSYATHLIEAGIDLRELQHILGHVSLLTTSKYTHLTQQNETRSQQCIDAWFSHFTITWGTIS